jgi:hypothetical protein
MKKQPFIIIFDIDKTIIGDISIIEKERALLEYIYNVCKKKGVSTKCPSMDLIDIQDVLKDELLRPNVCDFINFCDKKFKDTKDTKVEVFFYTNSAYAWTNDFIGKNLEKALKIKINRPFFTRENSMNGTMKKSLANIYPIIISVLAKRYPSLNDGDVAEYVLNNRTIFIDDIKDNIFAYTNRQLVCPAYNYTPYYDIYEKCITKYKMSPQIFDDKDILKYMSDNTIPVYNINGNAWQQNKEYIAIFNLYYTKHAEISKIKNADTGGTYYKDLIAELSKKSVSAERLTDKNIMTLNTKLSVKEPTEQKKPKATTKKPTK